VAGDPPPWHWLYVPEPEHVMYRVGHLSKYATDIAPPGRALLCAEIAFPGRGAAGADVDALRERVHADLERLGIVGEGWEHEFEHVGVIDCAYVIFDEHRRRNLSRVQGWLETLEIQSVGRYGGWDYGSMGDAVLEGRACAESVASRTHSRK
jgi:hypothetical protein